MLGLQDGRPNSRSTLGGVEYEYERIELAGRLRDKLFHGVPFRRKDLGGKWRSGYDLIEKHADHLVWELMGDCELEISRWANDA